MQRLQLNCLTWEDARVGRAAAKRRRGGTRSTVQGQLQFAADGPMQGG